jgi:hypothetical protein
MVSHTNDSASANSTGEDSLTCVEREIEDSINLPYSSSLVTGVRIFQSTYYSFLIIAGLLLSVSVMMLVTKFKKLRTLPLFVLLQVVVLDLMLSFTLIPGLVTTVAQKWLFGAGGCALTGLLTSIIALARTLLRGVFAVDRFLAIFRPSFYLKNKVNITGGLSAVSWIISVFVGFVMMPMDCYTFADTAKLCLFSSHCNTGCSAFVRTYGIVVMPFIILSVLLLTILYFKGRIAEVPDADDIPAADDVANENPDDPADPADPDNPANPADDNRPKKWRATRSFFLLFVSLSGLIFATTAIGVIIFMASSGDVLPPALHVLLVLNSFFALHIVILDPILFMLDVDVKKVVMEVVLRASGMNFIRYENIPPQQGAPPPQEEVPQEVPQEEVSEEGHPDEDFVLEGAHQEEAVLTTEL